jgi:hypothetical protein
VSGKIGLKNVFMHAEESSDRTFKLFMETAEARPLNEAYFLLF